MVESDHSTHINRVRERIENTVKNEPTQPILFFGSGITKRYVDGPSWIKLLEHLSKECPTTEREVGYYIQKGVSEIEIGSRLADNYYEWAYGSGRHEFPDHLYDEQEFGKDIFIKHKIYEYFDNLVPDSIEELSDKKKRGN